MDNNMRAESVARALETFAEDMGLDPDVGSDGPVTVAGDMIGNILHWVESQEPGGAAAALAAVKSGIAHYAVESISDEDEPAGPDAFVTITVECGDASWSITTGGEAVIN